MSIHHGRLNCPARTMRGLTVKATPAVARIGPHHSWWACQGDVSSCKFCVGVVIVQTPTIGASVRGNMARVVAVRSGPEAR